MPDQASDEPWQWSARAIADAVRRRRVSAREIAESHLHRIDALNSELNALVDLFETETLAEADAIDAAVAAGRDPGPLAGVPTAVKINTDQRGHATTHGVSLLEHAIAAEDAPAIANLRASGTLFIGRGNSPAFGYRSFTTNTLHGRTISPWERTRTPGGSSGGSSVAVATGMAALGQGNDLAGSIRYPAYTSGIVGLRPTVGRIPRGSTLSGVGESLMSQLMTVDGPLARTTSDLRVMYAAMSCAGDVRDLFWTPSATEPIRSHAALRVGVVRDVGAASPDACVNAALDQAAKALDEAGYQIEEVELPLLGEAFRLWWFLCLNEYTGAAELLDGAGDHDAATVVRHYETVAAEWLPPCTSVADFVAGYARRQVLIQQIQQFMQQYPLLLLPVSAEPAFEQDLDVSSVEGAGRFMQANWSMMALATVTLPAIAVPTGIADGLPMGVQIVGRRLSEADLFDASEVVERVAGPLTPIDPRR